MAAYDRLPSDLREWLRQAALPWSPRSALRVWRTALNNHEGDRTAAQAYLCQLERKMLKQDFEKTWGVEPQELSKQAAYPFQTVDRMVEKR